MWQGRVPFFIFLSERHHLFFFPLVRLVRLAHARLFKHPRGPRWRKCPSSEMEVSLCEGDSTLYAKSLWLNRHARASPNWCLAAPIDGAWHENWTAQHTRAIRVSTPWLTRSLVVHGLPQFLSSPCTATRRWASGCRGAACHVATTYQDCHMSLP